MLLHGFVNLLPDAPTLTPLQAAKQTYDGLTAREREVAALVAQGLTNRAMAEALVISERTVEKHVENASGKLGFTNRTQLAVWASEKGLTSG
ncbi:MAG: helix-turn-helix transcriptional regulator [Caldilineaceae bacterium]|nr:helix-turn-helix transcriptional regulator [Caldilineaceae bacterium]